MGIDTHVSGSTGQRLAFAIRDMLLGLRIAVLLCHTEVDDVDHVCCLGVRSANKEVVWFYVSIYEVLLMNSLYPGKLYCS